MFKVPATDRLAPGKSGYGISYTQQQEALTPKQSSEALKMLELCLESLYIHLRDKQNENFGTSAYEAAFMSNKLVQALRGDAFCVRAFDYLVLNLTSELKLLSATGDGPEVKNNIKCRGFINVLINKILGVVRG